MGEETSDTLRPWWRKALGVGALVAVVFQFLRGFRPPGGWAVTQLQLDYGHGFIKRGLPGTLLEWLSIPVEQHETAMWVGGLLTFASLVAVVGLILRTRVTDTVRGAAVALLAGSSYAIALLAHLSGYYDHIVIAVSALLLMVLLDDRLPSSAALPLSIATGLVALLSHEMFLFLGAPVVCLVFWLRGRRRSCVAFGAVMVLVTVAVMEWGTVELETFHEMYTADEAATNFSVQPATYRVLRRSSADNVDKRLKRFEEAEPLEMTRSVVVLLIAVLLFAYLAFRRVATDVQDEPRGRRVVTLALVIASSCGPLLLHLFGWDFHRFNALAFVASVLTLAVVIHQTEERPMSVREWRILVTIGSVLIVLNFGARFGFFEPYQPQAFPFRSHINALTEALEGR